MHYLVWPQVKREIPSTIQEKILRNSTSSAVWTLITPTDCPAAQQTDHAVYTSSVDAAACLMLMGLRGGRWRHHMEAMHSKRAGGWVEGTNSQQMERCRGGKLQGL